MAIKYIDLNTGELMHWKYIKREKLPNGKWRYYYDESELTKSRKRIDKYTTLGLRASAKAANAMGDAEKAKKDSNSAWVKKNTARTLADLGAAAKQEMKAEERKRKADMDVKTYTDISKHYHAMAEHETKKYNMKKITSLPARAISKGAVAVANFFENAKKAKKKNKPVVTSTHSLMYYK